MINVVGRVLDDTGAKMTNLTVEAVGEWLLTTKKLKDAPTDVNGNFLLEVPEIEGFDDIPRPFSLRVTDRTTKRVLKKGPELNGVDKNQNVGDIVVNSAEAVGLLVTNGTGVAEFVSEDNALNLLVDGIEAFGQVADDIKNAKSTINLTQLFFALPEKFAPLPQDEKPNLIFKFSSAVVPVDPLLPNQPVPQPRNDDVHLDDVRPERLIFDAAKANKKIKLLLNEPSISWPEGVFFLGVLGIPAIGVGAAGITGLGMLLGIGLAFFPVALGLAFLALLKLLLFLDDQTNVDDATIYFGKAIENAAPLVPDITVHGFRHRLPKDGVFHCKMLITDEERAVILGSPFGQRYYDSLLHRITDPQRGSNSSDAVHDLSIGVVGPAVSDLYESFRFFWNEDIEDGKLESTTKKPPKQANGNKVQVVRTMNGSRFAKLDGKSEKGILEGYLRAFAAAEHYIYLENQYFTDSVITEALVEVLKKKTNIELILVVPIKPDVLFYPLRQACRIEQLRKAGGNRVGVFTRWTYDEKHLRPWVAPVYIHAKGGIVDDSWATVGSANLDGLSLDYNLLLSPLSFGETTATELNVNIIPPNKGEVTQFARQMRKRLFAEHLGLVDQEKKLPNPEHPDLQHDHTHKWLKELWRPRAEAALKHVKEGKKEPLHGFVLEYPKEDGGWLDTPRAHLAALGITLNMNSAKIRPVTGTRSFHFDEGKWDKRNEREDFKGAKP